jgi:hypothetical protein
MAQQRKECSVQYLHFKSHYQYEKGLPRNIAEGSFAKEMPTSHESTYLLLP